MRTVRPTAFPARICSPRWESRTMHSEGTHPPWCRSAQGGVLWLRENPSALAHGAEGDTRLTATVAAGGGQSGLGVERNEFRELAARAVPHRGGVRRSGAGWAAGVTRTLCESVRPRVEGADRGAPHPRSTRVSAGLGRDGFPVRVAPAAGLGVQGAAQPARDPRRGVDGGGRRRHPGGGALCRRQGPPGQSSSKGKPSKPSPTMPQEGCSTFIFPTSRVPAS